MCPGLTECTQQCGSTVHELQVPTPQEAETLNTATGAISTERLGARTISSVRGVLPGTRMNCRFSPASTVSWMKQIKSAWRQGLYIFSAVLLAIGQGVSAEPLEWQVSLFQDSGRVANLGSLPAVAYSTVVRVDDAPWIQLSFDAVELAGHASTNNESYLILTSLSDGGRQTMHAEHIKQWQSTSAYFNGGAVLVELFAYPNTGSNRIVIKAATVGPERRVNRTICGDTDDRVLSNDPAIARVFPGNCTAWIIDDPGHCFLTAGHCSSVFALSILEFNVPLSNPNGTTNFAAPEDQYRVDQSSVQFSNGGIGNDWGYFGCFVNTTTGLTPFEAQGAFFELASTPPAAVGQGVRVTGYGFIDPPVSPTWHQVQKTHVGPFISLAGSTLQYTVDTTTGNSGSPVIDEASGQAIGIHTHGGCSAIGDANHGTAIDHAALLTALANPQGVCIVPCNELGDIDGDCDVDLIDAAILVGCMAGPGFPVPPSGCAVDEFAAADTDSDGDVDSLDFAALASAF